MTTTVLPGISPVTVTVPSEPVVYFPIIAPLLSRTVNSVPGTGLLVSGIGKNPEDGRSYIYIDYEPSPDGGIRYKYRAKIPEIKKWISREYGLSVLDWQIAQVKRNHGLRTKSRFGTVPEDRDVPPDKEAAIEAALRRFLLLP